jgi:hypothetical protein
MSDEAIRIFLARDLHEVHRDVQEHEEAELTTAWADSTRQYVRCSPATS